MARPAPFSRTPVVLVANAFGTWLSQALANLVQARGYRVHFVLSGRELLDLAPSLHPDVIVLDADLPDLDSIAVCRMLRQQRAAWNMPVMMTTATSPSREQRVAALEAGAWDYLSVLLHPEELTLKLDAMARLKLDMDQALEESAVDPASGLYTLPGLVRRARELTADAVRRHAPLACVALGISPPTLPAATAYAGQILQASGRTSDCVGSLGQGEFAVLAPATAPEGAGRMAQRLVEGIEAAGPRPPGVPPLRVHAGYDAVGRAPRAARGRKPARACGHGAASGASGKRRANSSLPAVDFLRG